MSLQWYHLDPEVVQIQNWNQEAWRLLSPIYIYSTKDKMSKLTTFHHTGSDLS